MSDKKWEILHQLRVKNEELQSNDIIAALLKNRGLTQKKEIEEFLNPDVSIITPDSVGIDKKQLQIALKRILSAIEKKERVVIFGDYDVDGICGAAILWETIFAVNPNAMPYIPHRVDEGYGLSQKGIDHVLELYPDTKLIITVDNGIVARDATDYANKKNIDVIITDHHVVGEKLPDALATVHTTKLCGTGVGYLLAQEIKKEIPGQARNDKRADEHEHLELVALATIADLVPLLGANRALTKRGLEVLANTNRIGLLELFKEAVINPSEITSYHVGHIIGPRLNAMGRLEYAMESLRLLCTKDPNRAAELAQKLGTTNRERQILTQETVSHAKAYVEEKNLHTGKLLFIADTDYQPGVIGLVAGRLVESYYRPSIVLSIGETHAKASARSISGFNIIEFIRTASAHLVDAGGHPMAAGFTVETTKLETLREFLTKKAEDLLTDDLFIRTVKIDMELPFTLISPDLYSDLQQLAPFGMGNFEPVFMTKDVIVDDVRVIGKEGKHLKLKVSKDVNTFDAIAFGMGELSEKIFKAGKVDLAYTIDINEWNGKKNLQLKVKDIQY